MASWSGTGGSCRMIRSAGENGLADAIWGSGNPAHAYAGSVVNRIQYRGRSRDYGLLSDAFRSEGADRRGVFDQNRFDQRNVAGCRDQIVVQILAFAGEELLHQCHAESLGNTALDLPFNQGRIDGPAHVVRGNDIQNAHRSE